MPAPLRIITYPIPPECDGMRITQFLGMKHFSRQNRIELKKIPGSVRVNGIPRHFQWVLKGGDELAIRIEETDPSDLIPAPIPLDILYEDEDLIVVNKPAGMPTHPSYQHPDESLANALAYYYQRQDRPFVFRCCGRLDRDTSGVIVASKHFVSASILSQMAARREISRTYLAICRGDVTPPTGTIDAPLGRREGSIIERTIDREHGERAVTHYEVLPAGSEAYQAALGGSGRSGAAPDDRADRMPSAPACVHERGRPALTDSPFPPLSAKNGYSLVRLHLETGRTHQIRIHMKYAGFPLIGDYLYNPDYERISRQALHSFQMSFTHPITGEPMCFTAPLPEDMRAVLLA